MILKETVDKVHELDIVQVIGDFVQLKRSGSNFKGLSPFTSERTASFMVSPAKHIFKCFSSGKGGSVVNFIMEHEHLTYPEAIRFLANKYGIEVLETKKSDEEQAIDRQKEQMYNINLFGQDYFKKQLLQNPEAYNYVVNQRQFSPEIIEKFNIGFAPALGAGLANQLVVSGYSWKIAVECSLLGFRDNRLYDRFRSRIMFPITTLSGNLIGFGGRYIGSKADQAKYLNSSDSIVYNKSEILYGIHQARKAISEKNMAYLVEGYADVVSFHQKGIENTVSPCGTALTSEQAKIIKRFTNRVTVIFDADNAGMRATLRSIDVLLAEGLTVYVCILPKDEDPDSYARTHSTADIQNYIGVNSKDFLIYKLTYLNEQAGEDFSLKSAAIVEVCASIAKIPNAIQREVYLKECARICDMNINSIREMVNTNNKKFAEIMSVPELETEFSISKIHIKEQCEKKILQYLLCYGEMILPFRNVYLGPTGDQVVLEDMLVRSKIIQEITEDNVEFSNMMYATLFRNLTLNPDQPIAILKSNMLPEMYLLVENLMFEETEMNKNSFFGDQPKELQGRIYETLSHSIHETLIYNKVLHVSDMVEEELSKEVLDPERVYDLLTFNAGLKRMINLI